MLLSDRQVVLEGATLNEGLARKCFYHTFPHLHTSFLLASAFFLLPLHLKPIKGSSGVREGKGKERNELSQWEAGDRLFVLLYPASQAKHIS